MLHIHLLSINTPAAEQLASNQLAVTDQLTGLFTRSGMVILASSMSEALEPTGEPIHVVLVQVKDLTALNADYGWEYGDAVLRKVASVLTAMSPQSDILARSDGRSFLCLGAGMAQEAADLELQLVDQRELTGIGLGKRPVMLAVGTGSGLPAEHTLEVLVNSAMATMASGSGSSSSSPEAAEDLWPSI